MPQPDERILLVQTSFPGDTILATPLIGALRSQYPKAELSILTTPEGAEIVRRDRRLRQVITYDKRGKDRGLSGILRLSAQLEALDFRRAYSLHRSYRTSLLLWLARIRERVGFAESGLSFLYTKRVQRLRSGHEIKRNLSLLGAAVACSLGQRKPTLFPAALSDVSAELGLSLGQDYGILVPGSVWATKRWEEEGFADLLGELLAKKHEVILLGAPNEFELCRRIVSRLRSENSQRVLNLAGKTTLAQAISLISRARFVVCNDSMALHAASAFDIPVVSVFGATSPAFGFGPSSKAASVVEVELDCRPCSRHGSDCCPQGHFRCMREVKVSTVLSELCRLEVI